MHSTKAILMAAGRGTRISRSIEDNCKCTLDIGGKPLIRRTAEMLLSHGIELHIIVGYNKASIYRALDGLDVHFHENIFYSVTNSLSSLWFARDAMVGESIILGNADVFWDTDILSILMSDPRDCTMLIDSSRVEQGDYLFNVDADGAILHYGKGMDCKKANCEYVGLAKIQGAMVSLCREHLIDKIERQQHSQWWENTLYDMIPERKIWTRDIAGHFWAEIDYIEDYQRVLGHWHLSKR